MNITRYVFLSVFSFFLQSCSKGQDNLNHDNGIHYFQGFHSGKEKGLPFSPDLPISEEDALKRQSYMKCIFEERKLVLMEKYLNGKVFFTQKIKYKKSGDLELVQYFNGNNVLEMERKY
jgi:hypothetical protein